VIAQHLGASVSRKKRSAECINAGYPAELLNVGDGTGVVIGARERIAEAESLG